MKPKEYQVKTSAKPKVSGLWEAITGILKTSNVSYIAEKFGLSVASVSAWKNHGVLPRIEHLQEIAAFGKTEIQLTVGSDSASITLLSQSSNAVRNSVEPYVEIIERIAKQDSQGFEQTVKKLVREALYARNVLGDKLDQPAKFKATLGVIWVPLLGKIAAGKPIERLPQVQMIAVGDCYPKHWKIFVLMVEGDSMRDREIYDGDRLVCVSERTPANGDVVIALIDGEESTVKTFETRDGKILLKPANPEFKVMEYYEPDRVYIQGVVLDIMKKPQK